MSQILSDAIWFMDPKAKLMAEIRKFSSMSARIFLLCSSFPIPTRRLCV